MTRPVALAALTAGEGTLSLKGTVGPGPAGEKVIVRLTQRHGNQDVIPSREWTIGAATALAEKFQPKVGQNRIEILARNESAAEGREECRLVLEVAFQPGTALQVATRAVVPLVGDGADPLPVEPGRPVILRVPRARIVGTVLASEPLVRAEWGPMVDGRPGKAQALTGSLAKERPIAETIDLQAGKQAFFFAETVAGEKAEQIVRLDYRPPTPSLVLTAPSVLYEGRHKGDLMVEGRLTPPPHDRRPYPLQASLVVDGQEMKGPPPEVDGDRGTLKARVPVQPGHTYSIRAPLGQRLGERLSFGSGAGTLSASSACFFPTRSAPGDRPALY